MKYYRVSAYQSESCIGTYDFNDLAKALEYIAFTLNNDFDCEINVSHVWKDFRKSLSRGASAGNRNQMNSRMLMQQTRQVYPDVSGHIDNSYVYRFHSILPLSRLWLRL